VLDKDKVESNPIPKQLVPSLAATLTVKAGAVMGEVANYRATATFVLNWLLSFSLSLLWGMINSLQIVVHFPLTSLVYPANAKLFYSFFITISTFDMLPTKTINAFIFTFSEEEAISENFEEYDYEKRNFIHNLGTLYYLFPLIGSVLVVLILLRLLGACGLQRPQQWYLQLRDSLFWNFLLQTTVESYLEMDLSSTINLTSLVWSSNSGDWLAAVTAILTAVVLNLLPFVLFAYLYYNFARLPEDEKFKKRIGVAYERLRTDQKSSLWHPFLFLLRRSLFSFLVIFAQEVTIV